VTKSMRKRVSAGHKVHIVYEAGPCGFVLQHHFSAQGRDCDVVAPSSVPRPSGERIKTDRRDAMKLGAAGPRQRACRGARAWSCR
jgi:transposase